LKHLHCDDLHIILDKYTEMDNKAVLLGFRSELINVLKPSLLKEKITQAENSPEPNFG